MLTLMFLVGLVTMIIVATILTEVEHFGFATVVLLVCVAGAQWFHFVDVLQFVEAHTLASVLYALGYVLAGVAWSFVKWFSFLMGFRDVFRTEREKFLTHKSLPTNSVLTDDLQAEFIKGLSTETRYGRDPIYDKNGEPLKSNKWVADVFEYNGNSLNVRPRATKNKARIVAWMSLWPCSVVGTVLNDPVRRLFNFLFNWFKSLYQQMADRVFVKDVELK